MSAKRLTKTTSKTQKTAEPSQPKKLRRNMLVVHHVDKAKKRVYIGVDDKLSTSRIEELQSEDAKQLAVLAASKAGLRDAAMLNQPSLCYFDTKENKLVSGAVGDREGVEMCLEVEVVSFGAENEFVGDSADAFPSSPQ